MEGVKYPLVYKIRTPCLFGRFLRRKSLMISTRSTRGTRGTRGILKNTIPLVLNIDRVWIREDYTQIL